MSKSLDELFIEEAEKLQIKKNEAEARIKAALAELGQACEAAGIAVTFRPPDAEVRITYTPARAAVKRWELVSDEIKDEHDAWGSAYGTLGWHASNVC